MLLCYFPLCNLDMSPHYDLDDFSASDCLKYPKPRPHVSLPNYDGRIGDFSRLQYCGTYSFNSLFYETSHWTNGTKLSNSPLPREIQQFSAIVQYLYLRPYLKVG